MPEPYSWEDDPMEGYGGGEDQPVEETPTTVSQTVVEETLDAPVDDSALSEEDWRLEKAQYYRSIFGNQLLQSEHPAAIEVEQELQDWARKQLKILLGIGVQEKTVAVAKLPFSPEEIEALKLLASRVLEKNREVKPVPAPVEPKPTPIPKPTPPVVRPVAPPAQPKVRPAKTNDAQRPRGRPRKNPCKVCHKMECEHLVRGTKSAAPPPPQAGETYEGLPIEFGDDGTRYVTAANGIRYRLDVKTVTHKQTGEQRQAYVPVEVGRAQPQVVEKKPYPSEEEAMALATVEAQKNEGKVQSAGIFADVLARAKKEADGRGSYVPQDTRKK